MRPQPPSEEYNVQEFGFLLTYLLERIGHQTDQSCQEQNVGQCDEDDPESKMSADSFDKPSTRQSMVIWAICEAKSITAWNDLHQRVAENW